MNAKLLNCRESRMQKECKDFINKKKRSIFYRPCTKVFIVPVQKAFLIFLSSLYKKLFIVPAKSIIRLSSLRQRVVESRKFLSGYRPYQKMLVIIVPVPKAFLIDSSFSFPV
jgi:hypothetical protein